MVYSSHVRCLIYGTEENLEAYITQAALFESSPLFREFKEGLSRYTIPMGVYDEDIKNIRAVNLHVLDLYGDRWEWYEGYEDVKRWTRFMRESEYAGLQYEFIRIGENDDDIETDNSSDPLWLIGVHHSISENFEKGKEIPLMI